MTREHATTGALSPTGIQKNGGGFINNEVRAQSYYGSLSDKDKLQWDADFKDYTSKGGKLNFWDWIASQRYS